MVIFLSIKELISFLYLANTGAAEWERAMNLYGWCAAPLCCVLCIQGTRLHHYHHPTIPYNVFGASQSQLAAAAQYPAIYTHNTHSLVCMCTMWLTLFSLSGISLSLRERVWPFILSILFSAAAAVFLVWCDFSVSSKHRGARSITAKFRRRRHL